ncbi:unnamed protein product [Ostreobium quekettii]|uniref:Uncharacterized protein n=1 Tax=Ostreobium quekettii TaxID=121088 RepID=A0A8S1JCU3_9CHLO|nr:unnamed protein product [Ostreobium quekettii]
MAAGPAAPTRGPEHSRSPDRRPEGRLSPPRRPSGPPEWFIMKAMLRGTATPLSPDDQPPADEPPDVSCDVEATESPSASSDDSDGCPSPSREAGRVSAAHGETSLDAWRRSASRGGCRWEDSHRPSPRRGCTAEPEESYCSDMHTTFSSVTPQLVEKGNRYVLYFKDDEWATGRTMEDSVFEAEHEWECGPPARAHSDKGGAEAARLFFALFTRCWRPSIPMLVPGAPPVGDDYFSEGAEGDERHRDVQATIESQDNLAGMKTALHEEFEAAIRRHQMSTMEKKESVDVLADDLPVPLSRRASPVDESDSAYDGDVSEGSLREKHAASMPDAQEMSRTEDLDLRAGMRRHATPGSDAGSDVASIGVDDIYSSFTAVDTPEKKYTLEFVDVDPNGVASHSDGEDDGFNFDTVTTGDAEIEDVCCPWMEGAGRGKPQLGVVPKAKTAAAH